MRLPNKVISYNDSIISTFPMILGILKDKDYSIIELYDRIKASWDIECYIDALDSLFALGKIEIDEDTRRLHYVI